MKTENLSTLQLNLLSNEQFKNALNNEKIDPNAFYLTPEENLFIRYAYDAEPTELFDTWAEGMSYIGFAYAEEAPTSYADYSWSLFVGSDGKEGQPGQSVHIRYSEYEDGTGFTDTWSVGQNYIGFAIGTEAPTVKENYTWCLFISNIRYTETIVLTVDGWNENKQTVAVAAVAENTTITASPAAETRDEYLDCGVVLVSAEAGNVTFECHHTPTKNVNIELIIIEPNGVYLPPEDNDYSWNDITDKPFYDNYVEETFTATFDGDKTDKIVFEDGRASYVWVSEKTIEDTSSIVSSSAIGMMGGVEQSLAIPNSMWEDISYALNGVPAVGAVYDPTNSICIAVSLNQPMYTYPAGIYVLAEDDAYVTSFTCTIGQGDIKRLDPKYLPEGGVGYEKVISSTNTITHDGRIDTEKDVYYEDIDIRLVKVSDHTPTLAQLRQGGTIVTHYGADETIEFGPEDIISRGYTLMIGFHVVVVTDLSATNPIPLLEKGIYFGNYSNPGSEEIGNHVKSLTLNGYSFEEKEICPIDPKFLPEGGFGYEVRRYEDADTLDYDPSFSNITHKWNGMNFRLVSKQLPTEADLNNSKLKFYPVGQDFSEFDVVGTEDTIIVLATWDTSPEGYPEMIPLITVVYQAGYNEFPEKGIYFPDPVYHSFSFSLTIPGYGKFGVEIHKIDPKFLPDTLATKADIQAYIDEAILNGAW